MQAAARAAEGATYRNQAVDARDGAVAASASAGTSASAAQTSKAATFPPRLDTDGSNFTTNSNGAATVGGLPASRVETVSGFGLVGTAADGATIYQRAPMAFRAGRVYRARVRFEVVAPAAQNVRVFLRGTDGDYATTASIVSAFASAAPGVVTELTLLYGNPAPSGGVLMGGNTSWVRAGAQSQGAISGGYLRIYEIYHEDVTESVNAANSAATSVAQAASASGASAEARISANLAAQVGQGAGYHKNPTWLDWTSGALPPSAVLWTAATTTVRNTASARYGACLEVASADGSNSGVQLLAARFVTPGPVTHVVVEYEVLLQSGSFRRSGLQASIQDDAVGGSDRSVRVQLYDEHGVGVVGQTYTGAKLLPCPAERPNAVRLYLFNNFAELSGGATAAKNLRWQRVNVRPASSAEIEAGKVQQIEGQLSITAAVAADTADRVGSARISVTGGAGGDPFEFAMQAGPEGSMGIWTATALRFRSIIGGVAYDVMKLVGNAVHIVGPLYVGPNKEIELNPISAYPYIGIKVGSGRIAMGRLPNDNLIYWFGPTQEVSAMRKNNAREWRDTTGSAYFGGQIFAGTISNSIQGSTDSAPVSVTLGPFSSFGAPLVVAWSFSFDRQGQRWGNQVSSVSGSTTALVRLYQKLGSAAETLVDSMTVTGTMDTIYDAENQPGQPAGTQGTTTFIEYMGDSRTFTAPAGVGQRTYRVEVASRSQRSISGTLKGSDVRVQRYAATSSE
ncbi:hypothetical protein D3C72_744740 [compost metagenome]